MQIRIPIQNAISSLNATVTFTLRKRDAPDAELQFSKDNDFLDTPVMLVLEEDIPA